MKTMKTIKDFRVTFTAAHEQYWQGHGIAFTHYTHCATGAGETLREAFEDAINQLDLPGVIWTDTKERDMLTALTEQLRDAADLDVDIVQAKCPDEGKHLTECPDCKGESDAQVDPCETCESQGMVADENPDCAVCVGDWHFYVSIDVQVEEGE